LHRLGEITNPNTYPTKYHLSEIENKTISNFVNRNTCLTSHLEDKLRKPVAYQNGKIGKPSTHLEMMKVMKAVVVTTGIVTMCKAPCKPASSTEHIQFLCPSYHPTNRVKALNDG